MVSLATRRVAGTHRPWNTAPNSRIQYGRVAGIFDHMDVLRYAAGICKDAFEPGATKRRLVEQFAAEERSR